MSLSIACVADGAQGPSELSSAAAILKQKTKAIVDSSYVRDGDVRDGDVRDGDVRDGDVRYPRPT